MSNDPSTTGKRSPKKNSPPGAVPKDGTEHDLWDMEENEPEDIQRVTSDVNIAASIPVRRQSGSAIQSKKPTERQIDTPIIQGEEKAVSKVEPEVVEEIKLDSELEETGKPISEVVSKAPAALGVATFFSSFTKVEKIGLTALFAILAVSATLTFLHFSSRVTTHPLIAEKLDLPLAGKLVTVSSVSTFWREPVTSGENADVVRRGTKLIPVLKIGVDGKDSVIRVFFKNEDGLVIGDAITKEVKGKSTLIIPATAGFDDIGMHAAYRTGESGRWIIEVLESSSRNASRDQFKHIFETEISTDMR